jgi:subtilisin family serine protease
MRGDIPSINPSKIGSWELIRYVLLPVIIIFGLASIIATGGGGGGGGGSLPAGGASGGIFPTDEITVAEDPELNTIQDVYGNDIEIAGRQIVAVFEGNATRENYHELETFLEDRNARIAGQIPALRMCQIEASNLADVMNLVIQLAQLPYIADAFPNRVYSLARVTDPSQIPCNWWTEAIQLKEGWSLFGDQSQIGNPDLKIGIVDSGIDQEFFDATEIGGDSKPRVTILNPTGYDVDNHGTAVAALAAGDRNDLHFPMVGVAPDSPVVSWDSKTRNSDLHDITQIQAGIAACIIEGKAKVVNVSIGTGSTENIKKAKDLRWQLRWSIWLAAQPEYEALLILASGNLESQEDNDLFPDHDERGEIDPELKEYWKEVYEKNAIIVTGTNKDNKVIYHYGDIIDLAAPGTDVTNAGDGVGCGGGSSVAAPQVAGAVALIWSKDLNLKPCEVKRALTDTGKRIEKTESGDDIRKYNIRILDLYNALNHTELTSPGLLTATIISPPGDLTIYEGESVYFDVSVRGETCSSEYEYFWTFGVGIPDYYGLVPGNKTFYTAGTYNVYFAVTNSADPWEYDYDSVAVTVKAQEELRAKIDSPPGELTVYEGGSVNFQGSVTGGKPPYIYVWDFDGAAPLSDKEDPGDIVFHDEGIYDVVFYVQDDELHLAWDSVKITVRQAIPDTPPIVSIETPSGTQRGDVAINYTLTDTDSDTCSIHVQYSRDSGLTYHDATEGQGGDGKTGLDSSPGGTSHVFVWDSVADIGETDQPYIRIKMTPFDSREGTSDTTEDFRVDNTQQGEGGKKLWYEGGEPDVRVCLEESEQLVPKAVRDGNGGIIIAWIDRRGGRNNIYVQKINSEGERLWGNSGVGAVTSAYTRDDTGRLRFRAAPDETGGIWLTWYESKPDSGTLLDIYVQRVNRDGVPMWGAEGLLLCDATYAQTTPALAPDGAGGVLIFWIDRRIGGYGGRIDLYGQRVNSSGVSLWEDNGKLIVADACGEHSVNQPLTVISDGHGGAIIGWFSNTAGSVNQFGYPRLQRVDGLGSLIWGSEGIVIDCDLMQWPSGPLLMTGGSSGAFVVFDRQDKMWVRKLSLETGTAVWASDVEVWSYHMGDYAYSSIIPDGVGGCVVALHGHHPQAVIGAQRVNSLGLAMWGGGQTLTVSAPDANIMRVLAVPDGEQGAIIAWGDERMGFLANYANHVDWGGQVLWRDDLEFGEQPGVLSLSDPLGRCDLISDDSGGAIVVWRDYANRYEASDDRIYAQRVTD